MLPVKRVVLYKHGVGYFERRGSVVDTASVDLHFRASEMNDVLKSLTTLDMGGGIISSISYESSAPVDKQLEDVSVRLVDGHALSSLFAETKGARITVVTAAASVTGTVLGIELEEVFQAGARAEVARLGLLVEGQSVRSFALSDIQSVTIVDDALRKDLQHLLDILIGSKRKDQKRLTIFTQGQGPREIFASYIIETPVWKTSYRILLSESEGPLLQGWALVDNTQDEDWESVALTLVSGLPISFVHDLYAPRYKRRPVVQVIDEPAYGPPVFEDAVPTDGRAPQRPSAMAAPPPPSAPMAEAYAAPRSPLISAKIKSHMQSSSPVQTRTQEVGDLFEYAIDNPVTVKRGQSALVPILLSRVEGRKVALYNPEVRAKNPMSAVLLKNTTACTLEGGPVTVMDRGIYVGEAMLETMKPGDERLVPFSVELGCTVVVEPESELKDVSFSKIVNGYLVLTRYRFERRVYLISVRGKEPQDLLIDHRITPGFQLVDGEGALRPESRTEHFYRFRVTVGAGETTRLVVMERGEHNDTRALTQVGRDELALWISSRWIDEPTHQILGSLIELQSTIADLVRRVVAKEQLLSDIFQNQERIRQNLAALGGTPDERGLRERYVAEMNFDEDRLKDLREEVRRDKTLKESLEHDLRERLTGLNYQSAVTGVSG